MYGEDGRAGGGVRAAAGYLGHADSWRAFEPWPPHEQWVVQAGCVTPWADPGTRAVAHALLKGQVIQVDGDQVRAPASLACEQASHSFVVGKNGSGVVARPRLRLTMRWSATFRCQENA